VVVKIIFFDDQKIIFFRGGQSSSLIVSARFHVSAFYASRCLLIRDVLPCDHLRFLFFLYVIHSMKNV